MKKAFTMVCAVCLALALSAGTALAADTRSAPAVIDSPGSAELLPVDIFTSADQLEIRKVYELSPNVDPGGLPRGGFERGGYAYECSDILREVIIGEESKTISVTETAESKKNDMNSVLGLFPQYKEYSDEDGFTGNLLLNTATIKSEILGYGSSSTPYTVSRSYPNLSDADTQYLPKSIDDNGRTLQFQDVQWRTDNTMNLDDYEIGDRYTAIATYVGTKTSSYVKGYSITADYSGEVLRKGVTIIRYTMIFTGTEIPAPEPPPAEPVAGQNGSGIWLPIFISILALLGSGACVYLTMKIRKETPRYEKASEYDYPDTYADDSGGDPGAGNGND